MHPEALAEMHAAAKLAERGTWKAYLGALYAAMGRKAEASSILSELDARRADVSPVALAALAVALGEAERAFSLLEDGYHERDPDLPTLTIEPGLKALHRDPRFQDLLRRVGLPAP